MGAVVLFNILKMMEFLAILLRGVLGVSGSLKCAAVGLPCLCLLCLKYWIRAVIIGTII